MNCYDRNLPKRVGLALSLTFASSAILADDLTDSEQILCYGWSAARCSIEGECQQAAPWELNLPDFLKIDLDRGHAITTETAPVERETEIDTVERADGTIILQGTQSDRAFSWVISEISGEGTLTVAVPGEGITIFTNCTPLERL